MTYIVFIHVAVIRAYIVFIHVAVIMTCIVFIHVNGLYIKMCNVNIRN